ncbi:MAG TPA: hypothetical protein PKJ82_03790, partial [Saprospiraceae bacterium]|nr:hypothetical protein [Saprospiraceae bacterium]
HLQSGRPADTAQSWKSQFTSKGIPWVLICLEEYRTREEALQQEKKIKGRGAGRYLSTRETGFKPSA